MQQKSPNQFIPSLSGVVKDIFSPQFVAAASVFANLSAVVTDRGAEKTRQTNQAENGGKTVFLCRRPE